MKRIQTDTAPSPPPIPQDPQPWEGSRVNEDRDPASQELDLGSAPATLSKQPGMWASVGPALIYPGSGSQQVDVHHLLSPPHPRAGPGATQGAEEVVKGLWARCLHRSPCKQGLEGRQTWLQAQPGHRLTSPVGTSVPPLTQRKGKKVEYCSEIKRNELSSV